jgi:hypothetical protein
MNYSKLFLLLVLLVIACGQKETNGEEQVVDTILPPTNKIISAMGETLIPKAKQAVIDWPEYQAVDAIMVKFYSISVQEALTNAQELSELVTVMKDSIRVPELDKNNVLARIHVLQNETLRLADMANITAITDDEVKEEIQKILEVYHAFHSKINTIYNASAIQEALDVDTETPVEVEKDDKPLPRPVRRTSSSKTIDS